MQSEVQVAEKSVLSASCHWARGYYTRGKWRDDRLLTQPRHEAEGHFNSLNVCFAELRCWQFPDLS